MCPVRQRGLCGKKLGQKAAERQKDDSIMAIPVKLEAFEGPLDLLLHLIEEFAQRHYIMKNRKK